MRYQAYDIDVFGWLITIPHRQLTNLSLIAAHMVPILRVRTNKVQKKCGAKHENETEALKASIDWSAQLDLRCALEHKGGYYDQIYPEISH